MLQDKSGCNFVPGTAVCLTTSKRKRNRGKKIDMKIVTDATYERILMLNVSNKEKSEYVKILEATFEQVQKTGKIT